MKNPCKIMLLALVSFLITAALALPTAAQMDGSGRTGKHGKRPSGANEAQGLSSDGVQTLNNKISATGLVASFPAGFECQQIASPFASTTRYDGSQRRDDRNDGLHGGIDLNLKEGAPLLAVASGEVIARGEGGRLEGIFLWLRHAPADTGLPYWVFTKYQHLSVLPELKVGDRVLVGQVIARSGKTGTTGGCYGAAGYQHLHLSTFYGPSEAYKMKGMYGSMAEAQGAVLDDPLILYLPGVNDLDQVRNLPEERKKVGIAVIGEDGIAYPPGSKTVWPVYCKRK